MADTRKHDRVTKGFYRARLSDSDVLYEILDPKEHPMAIPTLIQHLKNPEIYVFISANNDAIVVYLPTYGDVPWVSTHGYKKPGADGKKLKEFYIGTGLWIIENTHVTTITAIIPDVYRHHGLFLAHCGARRIAHVDDTAIYVFTMDRLQEFKEKLKCLN